MGSSKKWDTNLYNKKHGFVHQYGADLIDLLQPKPGDRILDLGCGSGQLTAKIAESGASVIGIDSSVEMIQAAKNLFPGQEFDVMDATSFSFAEPFDAIFSNAVLHWVKDQQKAVNCMFRSLNQNGKLVLEFGGKGNVNTIVEALKRSLRKRHLEENASSDIWFFPSISEYTSLLEHSGFEVSLAELYARPTKLDSRESGIMDWLEMFGTHFLKRLTPEIKNDLLEEVQEELRASCFVNGQWYADYKRIRIIAHKC